MCGCNLQPDGARGIIDSAQSGALGRPTLSPGGPPRSSIARSCGPSSALIHELLEDLLVAREVEVPRDGDADDVVLVAFFRRALR